MIVKLLNYFDRAPFRPLLERACEAMYYAKGLGRVEVKYHKEYRAYSFRIGALTVMSMGPGWAYSYAYLEQQLRQTYNYFYWPKQGDVIVDIGAGLGEESVIYASLVGNSGRVISVEANPRTHAGLAYMQRENSFAQLIPLHRAIYFEDGAVTIEDDHENYLTNTINKGGSIKVQASTLDSIAKEHGLQQIDFIKSNIEGAEQYLIQGMSDVIHRVRHVCISCHDFREKYHGHGAFYLTREKIRAYLLQNGFNIHDRKPVNRVVDDYIYATNGRFENPK